VLGTSRPSRTRPGGRPEANARLTASTAAVLLVLLAAEGVTILRVRPLLGWHVALGMLLLPPVLLKMATTGYRFARYYLRSPAYLDRGPPHPLLRLLGPFVVATTVTVFASGIALLVAGRSLRSPLLLLHKASFVLWFGAMTVHVLGHLAETGRLAPADWVRRRRSEVPGAGFRQWVLVASIAAGIPLAFVLLSRVGPWLAATPHINH
jgi:hypothetical protein